MLHIWIVNALNLTFSVYQTELHTLVKLKHLLKMLFFLSDSNKSNDKDTLVMFNTLICKDFCQTVYTLSFCIFLVSAKNNKMKHHAKKACVRVEYSCMQLLSLQGNSHQYPMNRSLGEPQSQSGCFGEEKSLSMPQIEPDSQSSNLKYCYCSDNFKFIRISHTFSALLQLEEVLTASFIFYE